MGTDLTTTAQQAPATTQSVQVQAEVQAAAVMAMNRPRDEAASWLRIAKSCQRPGFADGAEYSYTRGDSNVHGPSVKLAREMARCWGNVQHGIRVLSMDSETVHIEGWAWDVETNQRVSSEARFARKVQRVRGGETVWVEADERNLRELVNKHGAIAVRNSILQLLPPDMVDEALKIARKTLAGSAQEKLEEDRDEVVAKVALAWRSFDVTQDMLEKHLGRPADNWTGDDVAKLRSIYQSVRDGNSQVSEYFDVSAKRTDDAKNELEQAVQGELGTEAEPKTPPRKKAARNKGSS